MALAVMIIPPPYPVFVIGYFVLGFSFATSLALNNVFCANVEPATTTLGAYHGSYGVGGTIAPLIATAMVTSGIEFSRFYALLLAIRVLAAVSLGWTFRDWTGEPRKTADDIALTRRQQSSPAEDMAIAAAAPEAAAVAQKKASTLLTALRTPTTLIGALFIFAYQGAEVSISGWVISFLITFRNGDPSKVGYVTVCTSP